MAERYQPAPKIVEDERLKRSKWLNHEDVNKAFVLVSAFFYDPRRSLFSQEALNIFVLKRVQEVTQNRKLTAEERMWLLPISIDKDTPRIVFEKFWEEATRGLSTVVTGQGNITFSGEDEKRKVISAASLMVPHILSVISPQASE